MLVVNALGFSLMASVALLAVTVIRKLRLKRPVPTFNETYFRDVPSDDHPAVLATFMNKGTVPDRAFVATLMKLTDDRLIKLQSVATPGQKAASDYCISMSSLFSAFMFRHKPCISFIKTLNDCGVPACNELSPLTICSYIFVLP